MIAAACSNRALAGKPNNIWGKMEFKAFVEVAKLARDACHSVRRTRPLVWYKNRTANAYLKPLHLEVVHRARRLAAQMSQLDGGQDDAVVVAIDTCTACRVEMGKILGLRENHLHCCLKLMAPTSHDGRDQVGTIARSRPFDGRPGGSRSDLPHPVHANTVWSALMGENDGITNWPNGITCFSSNDLPGHGTDFWCDRERWQDYYKSTLVFPLRYAISCTGNEMGHIGFLAFDCPKTGGFRGLPDIFDYRQQPADYRDRLYKSAAFHLGAMMADILGTFLGATYETPGHPQDGG